MSDIFNCQIIKPLEKFRKTPVSSRTTDQRKELIHSIADAINTYLDVADPVEKYIKNVLCGFTKSLIDKIEDKYKTFYEDPASTKYHGAYKGGLFDHSVAVYEAALRCAKIYGKEYGEISPIACIYHDLCKSGIYVFKTEKDKDGNEKTKIDYNQEAPEPIGHGAETLRRLYKLGVKLNEEWELAIYHHMGVFDSYTSKNDVVAFSKITEKIPEVLLLHHADMIACKIYHI